MVLAVIRHPSQPGRCSTSILSVGFLQLRPAYARGRGVGGDRGGCGAWLDSAGAEPCRRPQRWSRFITPSIWWPTRRGRTERRSRSGRGGSAEVGRETREGSGRVGGSGRMTPVPQRRARPAQLEADVEKPVVPDGWNACSGSRATAIGVLGRWPRIDVLARARTSSIIKVEAEHPRRVSDVERRAVAIRDGARRWSEFWDGRLDFEALGWEVAELIADLTAGEERVERAGLQAQHFWQRIYGDDPLLLSVPGMGPRTAPTVRAFFGDARQFESAKQTQAYVGLNPSNWSSGQTASPSRAITKEGPSVLRLAFY